MNDRLPAQEFAFWKGILRDHAMFMRGNLNPREKLLVEELMHFEKVLTILFNKALHQLNLHGGAAGDRGPHRRA